MGRSELREHIFRILFRIEFQPKEEMEEQLALYLEELESAKDTEKEYIRTKYAAIAEKVEMIDEKINASVTGWKTSRMGKVDLTILRLAVYEIEWDEEVPQGVAINEAVELAKRYGGEESPFFHQRSSWKDCQFEVVPCAVYIPSVKSILTLKICLHKISCLGASM